MYFFGFSAVILITTLFILLFKIKKIGRFLTYRRIVKNHKSELLKRGVNIDWIYRMYTVKNFDPDLKDDIKVYGYDLLDTEVRKTIREIQDYLSSIGLLEFIGTSRIDRISEFSVLLVIESRHLNTRKYLIRIIISVILILLGLTLGLIF